MRAGGGAPLDPGSVIDQVPVAVAATRGPDHVVELLNPAAKALAGGRDLRGWSLRELVPEPLAGILDRVYETGQRHVASPRRPPAEIAAGAAEDRFFSVGCEPRHDPAGAVTGLVLWAIDVTDQKVARERADFLSSTSAVLLEASLRRGNVLEQAARLAASELAELAIVNVLQPDGTLVREAVAHRDPAKAPLARQLHAFPPHPETSPAVHVAGEGTVELIEEFSDEDLRALSRSEDHLALMRELGFGSGVVVPLRAAGKLLGTLSLISPGPRRFTAEDVAVAQSLATRAGLALDSAEQFEAAERARAATEQLQHVTSALSRARTRSEVAEIVVGQGASFLGAEAGSVFVLTEDGGHLEQLVSVGWTGQVVERFRRTPLTPGRPVSDAIVSGTPLWLASADDWMARYPDAGAIHAEGGYSAAAVVPLLLDEQAIGGLTLSFSGPRAFSEDERTYLLALGAQCAQALERARLYEAEQEARQLAERQRDRMSFLAEASLVLDALLDSESRLRGLAQLAVPRIADWCGIDLLERGGIRHVAAIHSDPAKVELANRLREQYPPDPSSRHGVPEVLRTGRSQLVPVVTDDMLIRAARDPEHLRSIRELGLSSFMVVPLTVRGRTFGALSLVAAESRAHYDEEDLAYAEELARRAALSLDNARLFEAQQRIARTLQSSLLPRQLPVIPGMRTAARYIAAGEGNEVGGDFYDLFSSEGGWSIVIGDVQGKGPQAAALTALVRYTIRAESQHDHSPSRILARLNAAMLREQLGATSEVTDADFDTRFCSVLSARLLRTNGGLRLILASAGHPTPLIVRGSGEVERIECDGTVLGIYADPKLTDVVADVRADDLVVFYTDGVTEGRGDEGFYGERRLERLLADCVGWEPEQVASRVIDALLGFQRGRPRDDMAVLVLGG